MTSSSRKSAIAPATQSALSDLQPRYSFLKAYYKAKSPDAGGNRQVRSICVAAYLLAADLNCAFSHD